MSCVSLLLFLGFFSFFAFLSSLPLPAFFLLLSFFFLRSPEDEDDDETSRFAERALTDRRESGPFLDRIVGISSVRAGNDGGRGLSIMLAGPCDSEDIVLTPGTETRLAADGIGIAGAGTSPTTVPPPVRWAGVALLAGPGGSLSFEEGGVPASPMLLSPERPDRLFFSAASSPGPFSMLRAPVPPVALPALAALAPADEDAMRCGAGESSMRRIICACASSADCGLISLGSRIDCTGPRSGLCTCCGVPSCFSPGRGDSELLLLWPPVTGKSRSSSETERLIGSRRTGTEPRLSDDDDDESSLSSGDTGSKGRGFLITLACCGAMGAMSRGAFTLAGTAASTIGSLALAPMRVLRVLIRSSSTLDSSRPTSMASPSDTNPASQGGTVTNLSRVMRLPSRMLWVSAALRVPFIIPPFTESYTWPETTALDEDMNADAAVTECDVECIDVSARMLLALSSRYEKLLLPLSWASPSGIAFEAKYCSAISLWSSISRAKRSARLRSGGKYTGLLLRPTISQWSSTCTFSRSLHMASESWVSAPSGPVSSSKSFLTSVRSFLLSDAVMSLRIARRTEALTTGLPLATGTMSKKYWNRVSCTSLLVEADALATQRCSSSNAIASHGSVCPRNMYCIM
eukprot:comp22746_c0_seq1/m.57848 comp22746_c0_seq1/g.57848  ORF comp22746_c0_seq1/g.57848 comp22746_c0_seq1/m.57848 type:complete len:632 (+) comp22746_c0_seq1:414-2309(+)